MVDLKPNIPIITLNANYLNTLVKAQTLSVWIIM